MSAITGPKLAEVPPPISNPCTSLNCHIVAAWLASARPTATSRCRSRPALTVSPAASLTSVNAANTRPLFHRSLNPWTTDMTRLADSGHDHLSRQVRARTRTPSSGRNSSRPPRRRAGGHRGWPHPVAAAPFRSYRSRWRVTEAALADLLRDQLSKAGGAALGGGELAAKFLAWQICGVLAAFTKLAPL